jgi:mRNA interferase YafQ
MYTPHANKRFKKDIELMRKNGKNMNKLISIMHDLAAGKILPAQYKDHKLVGNYIRHRECHIEPDWLLIYRIENPFIYFERTGTHSNLFKK